MFTTAVMSGHLTRTKNTSIPDEFLVDVHLTKSGLEIVQNVWDRIFSEGAIIQARKSVSEDDRLHPHVGVVIVKDGTVLATGHRGESGEGDHGEYCALKKLSAAEIEGSTVYTTLEPCSSRKPPKKPCTPTPDRRQRLRKLSTAWQTSTNQCTDTLPLSKPVSRSDFSRTI